MEAPFFFTGIAKNRPSSECSFQEQTWKKKVEKIENETELISFFFLQNEKIQILFTFLQQFMMWLRIQTLNLNLHQVAEKYIKTVCSICFYGNGEF